MNRTVLFVLLLVLALPAAWAQQMTCTASAPSPPAVRAEGLSELIGDVVLTCTGGTPVTGSAPFPRHRLELTLNTQVASRILNPLTEPLVESLLFIDDPAPSSQLACVEICQNVHNVFQAALTQFGRLRFADVPINPPGPGVNRVLRIKNVRVNAQLIPVTGQVIGVVALTGPADAPIVVANSQQNLAIVQRSLNFEVRSITDTAQTTPPAFVACTGNNIDLAGSNTAGYTTPGGRSFHLFFSETIPAAFRRRTAATNLSAPTAAGAQDSPVSIYNTDTGFYNPGLPVTNGLNRAGLADHGTRLRAQFTNVPANVKVFVTVREAAPGTTMSGGQSTVKAQLTTSPGPFSGIAPDSTADGGLKLVPANGEVVWEILESDTAVNETVSFGVAIAFTSNPQPAGGTASVTGSYAPQSIVGMASASEPLPRFGSLIVPIGAFSVTACRTSMLFQFVTNRVGFDTGIAVTNSSRDTLGTTAQAGSCTANFFPTPSSPAVPPLMSPGPVIAGEQWTFVLSGVRPNFQGYLIVTCDFQYAHGYAFISDLGVREFAQGYQALIIPDRRRVADPMSTSGAGTGEQLVH